MTMKKTLPHNREAEEALAGSLLIDPDAYAIVAPIVAAEDFYNGRTRFVYEAIEALEERGEALDYVTIADELERRGRLKDIGGAAYLTQLTNVVPSALHVREYAERVRDNAQRRRLIKAASDIAQTAYDIETDIEEAQAQAESAVLDTRRDDGRTVTAGDVASELFEDIKYWQEHPTEVRGLATGLAPLDKMIGGLKPGLCLLAARPSMGKTAVALQAAANAAKQGEKVIIFTLEMGKKQLTLRVACSEAGVPQTKIEEGKATPEEYGRFVKALGEIADWPLILHDRTVTAGDIRAVVQRETMCDEEVGLVVVDYLGLMAASKDAETRNLELGAISRGLLLAGKDLDVPILALHQLNRNVDNRSDKRPVLSDLRESGRLEEDADVVLMLYRDGYYNPDSERVNVMEIWVKKNRLGGPAGDRCEMFWHGDLMRCEPLEYMGRNE